MPIAIIPEFDIADYFAALANALFHYRVKNDNTLSNADWDALRQVEHNLMEAVVDLRANAVGTLAQLGDPAKGQVTAAVQKMNSFANQIASIQKALKVATAAIGLAGALLAGGVPGIITAAGKLKTAAA